MSKISSQEESSSVEFAVRPLSPALGAEVIGIDAASDLDLATVERIKKVWHENQVILLRGQKLDEAQQVRFTSLFGELQATYRPEYAGAHPAVVYIGNLKGSDGKGAGALPTGEMQFHIDQCYVEHPAKGTMLYSIEIPSRGGNTLFSNAYKAYDSLPESVKKRLEGRRAVNVFDYSGSVTDRKNMVAPQEGMSYSHPIVRTHPATSRKSLFVNRLMTHHIEGLPHKESEELLELLFEMIDCPESVYEHQWRVGDLLLWDNRCTLHARSDFDPSERRWMRRVTLRGDKPF